MTLSEFVRQMGPVRMALAAIVAVAIAAFGAGGTAAHILAQQKGLPASVNQNTQRIAGLEDRLERVEWAVRSIRENRTTLDSLRSLVDSLFVLEADSYCLLRSHTYGLDPDVACRQTRRQ